MLENAGAIVYTPRERDTQKNEIIVDNDTPNASLYLEMGGKKINWANAPVRGFAQKKQSIKMEKILSLTEPVVLFRQRERKRRIKTRYLPNGCLLYRQQASMQFMFPTKHCPTV